MQKISKKSIIKDRKFGQILGINVISADKSSVLASVKGFLSSSIKFAIVTPNPELILMAQKNEKLKEALNSADLPVPDGVGLKLADSKLNIIKGRELFTDLIKLAEKENWKVFLLGGLSNEAELTAARLKKDNLGLRIDFFRGPVLDENAEPVTEVDKKIQQDAIDKINKFTPEILFVAFGNPKQEIWAYKNLKKLNVGGVASVGGSFRYASGLSKLPPKWMEKAGLEWLYRLITEPKRIGRIFNAVILFPLTLLFQTKY